MGLGTVPRWQPKRVMLLCRFKPVKSEPVSLIYEISSDLDLLPSLAPLAISLCRHARTYVHACTHICISHSILIWVLSTCSHHLATEHPVFFCLVHTFFNLLLNFYWFFVSRFRCLSFSLRNIPWLLRGTFLGFSKAGAGAVLWAPTTSSASLCPAHSCHCHGQFIASSLD